ncbi:hypothetical protein V7793_05150 [Streptomyces sp. KLMMK]|uniref:hypothetical protein n=1 Tax=Streptomyces sp. KLMMK TaxID=3109353 RepID=UPI002FFFF26C
MPQHLTGTASRLIIGKLLYDWDHQDYCLIAYTGLDNMGVVGTFPDANGDAPDLWSIAARHESQKADYEDLGRWCLCTGWALSSKPRDTWIEVTNQPWKLEVRNTLKEIKPHQYGNTAYGWKGVHVGVLTVDDPDVIKQAHALLS